MYRQRRKRLHKRRRAAVVVASAAVLGLAISIPTFASASGVSNLLGSAGAGGSGGSGGTSGTSTVDPRAGVPPTYTPPLHGTSPHGQGTDAVVDIQPSDTNPYSGDPSSDSPGSGEEVIAGDSRGEQGANGYNGKVTLLYLFGTPIVQVTSNPGESNDGPLQPIQDQVLDQICQGSGGQLCLTVLGMHSSSTANSSNNSFQLLGADIGGASGLHVNVLSSHGNISDDGSCQTAFGDSNVAHVGAGDQSIVDALQGDSTSTACSGGASTTDQHSTVLALGGNGLPIPAAGCDNGTPNTQFVPLAPLLAATCNADDTNGSQTSAPYGVREALALFALISGNSSLLKVTGGAAESHAVAPGGGTPPGGNQGTQGAGGKGGNKGGNGGNAGGNGGGAGNGAGAAANQAAAGNGSLAFTGADLLVLGLVGGALILGGLALTTMAGRRHRQTV
jgi:hypothetical protein